MRLRFHAFRALPAFLAIASFAAFGALRAHADTQGHFDRTLSVSGPVDMEVQTGSGDIVVRPGSSGQVQVHGTIHAGWHVGGDIEQRVHDLETNPPIEQNGNTIRIGHVEDHERMRNISISYEIVVPAETRLRASSGSGNVRAEGINGPADANSGSGNITLANIAAETHGRSGSGDISLSSIRGAAKASTGSGSIRATGIAGGFTGSSGSGDVRVEQTAAGDTEISTGSGSVEAHGVKGALRASTGSGNIVAQGQPTGEWKLRTGSRNVDVEFPADAAYELYAHSSSGSIHTNQEMTVQGTISSRELHGKVHGGGPLVDLSTSSGSINIR